MRLDRLVNVRPKETVTSVPDIRLSHPPCTTDSECMVNNNIAMSTFHKFRIIKCLDIILLLKISSKIVIFL